MSEQDSNTIWDESMNYEEPDGWDYGRDDYDSDDYEDYIEGQAISLHLVKGHNGKLAIVQGVLTCFRGEDWGEASGWDEYSVNLNDLLPEYRSRAIELGRTMQNNSAIELHSGWREDDDDTSEDHELNWEARAVDEALAEEDDDGEIPF